MEKYVFFHPEKVIEQSEVLDQTLDYLKGRAKTKSDVEGEFEIPLEEVKSISFGCLHIIPSTGKNFMSDHIFVDTNILVYAVADDLRKRDITDQLLLSHDIVVSAQVISEFIVVTIRKHILETPKTVEYAKQFMQVFQVVPLTTNTITSVVEVMGKYDFSYWDSLILAAALESGCPSVYSEDLQDGQRIEEILTIINPFK